MVVEIKVSNVVDIAKVHEGVLRLESVRTTTPRAIVDTGATLLVLPEEIIARLGIPAVRQVTSRVANGRRMERPVYGPVRVEVQGRVVNCDTLSSPPGGPAFLGQIPLEGLDFVVDLQGQRLIPNPKAPDPNLALVDVF